MGSRTAASRAAEIQTSQSGGDALRRYIQSLKAMYLEYTRPAADVRRAVDESMGGASLTGVLDESRGDKPA